LVAGREQAEIGLDLFTWDCLSTIAAAEFGKDQSLLLWRMS
jgi:hypothetical protein